MPTYIHKYMCKLYVTKRKYVESIRDTEFREHAKNLDVSISKFFLELQKCNLINQRPIELDQIVLDRLNIAINAITNICIK